MQVTQTKNIQCATWFKSLSSCLFLVFVEYISFQNSRKETCLYLACEVKDWLLVKYFLTNNADPNIGAMSGKKPIHFVCESNNLEMLKLLLKHKATPNQLFQGKNEKSLATSKEVDNSFCFLNFFIYKKFNNCLILRIICK